LDDHGLPKHQVLLSLLHIGDLLLHGNFGIALDLLLADLGLIGFELVHEFVDPLGLVLDLFDTNLLACAVTLLLLRLLASQLLLPLFVEKLLSLLGRFDGLDELLFSFLFLCGVLGDDTFDGSKLGLAAKLCLLELLLSLTLELRTLLLGLPHLRFQKRGLLLL
jgi:hypothetical protein